MTPRTYIKRMILTANGLTSEAVITRCFGVLTSETATRVLRGLVLNHEIENNNGRYVPARKQG